MAKSYTDSFNRTDSGTPGGNLTTVSGVWQVVSNQLKQTATTTSALVIANVSAPLDTNDMYAEFKVGGPSIIGNWAIATRISSDHGSYYYLRKYSSTEIRLYQLVSGGSAVSIATASYSTAVGDTLRIEAYGSTIRGLVNGTVLMSVTDTTIPTGTYGWGIRMLANSQNQTFDDAAWGDYVVTPDTTAPTVPTGLTSSAVTSTGYTLTWTSSTDAVGVTGYGVYENGSLVATPTTASYTATGRSSSTAYSLTVVATDAANNTSTQSSALIITTTAPAGDTTAPSVPSGLASTAIFDTGFTVSWTASTDAVGVAAYDVYLNGTLYGSPTTTTLGVAGQTPTTAYSVTVRARDAAGNASVQSSALIVTTTATITGSPDNFDRADSGTPGGALTPVVGAWAIASNQLKINSGSSAAFIISNLDPVLSNDMYAQVKVVGPFVGNWGIATRITMNGSVPSFYFWRHYSSTQVRLYKVINGSSIVSIGPLISLTVVDGDIMRIEAVGSTIRGLVNGAVISEVVDTDLPTGQTAWGIRTLANSQNQLFDNAAWGIVTPVNKPTAPTNVHKISAQQTQLTVGWDANTDVIPVTQYKVYVNDTLATTASTNQAVLTGLSALTTYSIRISAADADGNSSDLSDIAKLTTASNQPFDEAFIGVEKIGGIYYGPTLLWGHALPVPLTSTPSYGPNGTHWPTRTPTLTDAVDSSVEVACTWDAISLAINNAPLTGTTKILVQPGVLTGNGSGSTAKPAAQNLGTLGRTNRILVAPRDGFGTVTFSNNVRIHNVKGVSFVGFDFTSAYGLVITACEDFAWARSRASTFNITGVAGFTTARIELVECVSPDSRLLDGDTWGWRTASGADGGLDTILALGCYVAPTYRSLGSSSHTDTWQLSGQGGNTYNNITYQDTAVWASTNSAVQYGSATGLIFKHMLVVAATTALNRYPVLAGADPVTAPHAMGGGAIANGWKVYDSIVIGNLSTPNFIEVQNSITSETSWATTFAPSVGGWTYDASIQSWNASQFDIICPYPTTAYLHSIWN